MTLPPEYQYLIPQILSQVTMNYIQDGLINPVGKTSQQIIREFAELYYASGESPDIQIVLDHTRDILKQARIYKRAKNYQFACLFYAMWIEHYLNHLISILAKRKNLNNKEIECIVRESSYKAKCTWLLHLLSKKPFSQSHVNLITRLMEIRNSFVHYRWKPDTEQSQKEIEVVISKIDATVKYMQNYEVKHITGISRRKVEKLINDNFKVITSPKGSET